MQILLTEAQSELLTAVEASTVMIIKKDPTNKLITHVITGIMGPGGLQALAVRETPEEVARRVNNALRAQVSEFRIDVPNELLGFKDN